MSLKVWLPLLGNLDNQGTSDLQFTQSGTAITVDANGKIGQCYTRATAKSAGRIESNNTILLNGDLSMCCWAKVTATVGDTANGLVSNHNASNNSGFGINVKQVSTSDYRISCSTGNGSSRTYMTYYGTTNIKNTWHHLALTYNNTTHQFQLWVDGIVEKTQSYTNSAVAGKILVFDWNLGGSNNSYKPACSLNDVRIYDHCLSAKEIKEISKGLVLHYQLDSWAPDGYNRLEYIESQGQILDLQTSQATDICYEFTAWCSSNKANYLFGSKQFSSMAYNGMYRITGIELNYQSQTLNSEVVAPSKITLYQSITDNVITNVLNGKTTTHSIGNLNANDTGTICFFGIPNTTPRYYGDTVRLYWLKIKNASGIVRNLIPVQRLSDGTVGMYDLKNSAFLSTNISTSVTSGFIAGPTVGVPGTTVYDCSGYKHDGTLVGTISTNIVSPRYTSSIDLVNGNSMINCGRGGMVTDALTVNFWCYSISGNRPASCTEGAGWNFEPSNNNIQFQVYQAGVGYCGTGASPIVMSSLNNAWHMYTGVYDRLNSKSKLYIDGELAIERTFDGTGLIGYHNTNVIWIGGEATASATTGSAGTAGYFSDFRIYSTALSVTDIQELYNVSMEIDANGNVLPRMLN